MLWMGSLALAFSIYSIRFTMVLSLEPSCIAGILLFAFSFFCNKVEIMQQVTFQPFLQMPAFLMPKH
jgi:hypothetical protein